MKAFLNDFKRLVGITGRGATSRLAMKCQILPATLYNMESIGKDLSVSTLVRMVRGTDAPHDKVIALLLKHYKD